jgi:hypothetical protein
MRSPRLGMEEKMSNCIRCISVLLLSLVSCGNPTQKANASQIKRTQQLRDINYQIVARLNQADPQNATWSSLNEAITLYKAHKQSALENQAWFHKNFTYRDGIGFGAKGNVLDGVFDPSDSAPDDSNIGEGYRHLDKDVRASDHARSSYDNMVDMLKKVDAEKAELDGKLAEALTNAASTDSDAQTLIRSRTAVQQEIAKGQADIERSKKFSARILPSIGLAVGALVFFTLIFGNPWIGLAMALIFFFVNLWR